MKEIRVLYDGWPLVRQPDSPASLHLQTLLAYLPDEVQALLALPEEPLWPLPAQVEQQLLPTPDTEAQRLIWEQSALPRLFRASQAHLLHLMTGQAALFGPAACALSPAAYEDSLSFSSSYSSGASQEPPARRSLAARLRQAISSGAQTRAAALFWPDNLPAPQTSLPVTRLPPVVHPAFHPPENGAQIPAALAGLDIPETYLLYHGPFSRFALQRLAQAWSWAGGSIGTYYPLLLVGLDEQAKQDLEALRQTYELQDSVRALPDLPLETLAGLYRGCSALFHPAPLPAWGGPILPALASAKAVVASYSPFADAQVGPAAYLVATQEGEKDARALGAALISVIVEDRLREELVNAARSRSAAWDGRQFRRRLLEAYRGIAGRS